jgi:hypothetical protein
MHVRHAHAEAWRHPQTRHQPTMAAFVMDCRVDRTLHCFLVNAS